jgi:hypothetical protein
MKREFTPLELVLVATFSAGLIGSGVLDGATTAAACSVGLAGLIAWHFRAELDRLRLRSPIYLRKPSPPRLPKGRRRQMRPRPRVRR